MRQSIVKKNSVSITEIFNGDKTNKGEMEIANEFNNFFSKVGEKISKSIAKVNTKP